MSYDWKSNGRCLFLYAFFLPGKDGDCLDNGQELHVLNSQKKLSISCFMIMILQYCDFFKPERFRKALILIVNILFSLESWHTNIGKVYEFTSWNPWTLRLPTLSRHAASLARSYFIYEIYSNRKSTIFGPRLIITTHVLEKTQLTN